MICVETIRKVRRLHLIEKKSIKEICRSLNFLTSDIFSYKSLILLCLGCQKALHGLFSPAIVSEC
ncbi:hypothetical protein [Ruegeria sp.]|uniref:hypothetical protein n=1 Tax=Ruegeria sp. TaxID=1879320 RepID=UPI003AFFBBE5